MLGKWQPWLTERLFDSRVATNGGLLASRGAWCQRKEKPRDLRSWWGFPFSSQVSSALQSCPTLFDPMDCSMPGFPVHHQHLELAQSHVHQVGDAIQPSDPLSSPSPSGFNLSQHQGLSQGVSSSHQVAKVLEFHHNTLLIPKIRMTVGSWSSLQTPNYMPFFFIFAILWNNNPMTHPFAQLPGHLPHKIFSKSLCSSIKGHLHFAFPLGQCFVKLTLLHDFALSVYLFYHYLLFIVPQIHLLKEKTLN